MSLSVRFCWLRITQCATPRPEYWAGLIDALQTPKGGNPVEEEEGDAALADFKWMPTTGGIEFDDLVVNLYQSGWVPERADIQLANQVYASQAFVDAREALQAVLRRGWAVSWESQLLETDCTCKGWQYFKRWRPILTAHSRWSRAMHGDTQAAVEDWLIVVRMASRLLLHPAGIPRARELIFYLTKDELYPTVSEAHESIDTAGLMRELDTVLGEGEFPLMLVQRERLSLFSRIDQRFVREGGDWMVLSDDVRDDDEENEAALSLRMWNVFSPLFIDRSEAERHVEEVIALFENASNIAALPWWKPGQPNEKDHVLHGTKCPGIDAISYQLRDYYLLRCRLEAGVAMLAIIEFQSERGRLPDRLEELVPAYLPRAPIDFCDGRTLRYLPQDPGYLLYSIGLDCRDDGGSGNAEWEEATPGKDTVYMIPSGSDTR